MHGRQSWILKLHICKFQIILEHSSSWRSCSTETYTFSRHYRSVRPFNGSVLSLKIGRLSSRSSSETERENTRIFRRSDLVGRTNREVQRALDLVIKFLTDLRFLLNLGKNLC